MGFSLDVLELFAFRASGSAKVPGGGGECA